MDTTFALVFQKCVEAIKNGVLIERVSVSDKEFHFQNWFKNRLAETELNFETGGRNSYPDFRIVSLSDGYELKGLAYPGRDASFDSNSQVPTGYHNGRHIYYVFGRYIATDLGRSNYNALQVKVDKSYANGVSLLLAYTWAKTMDNNSDIFGPSSPENSYNLNADYGLSDADRPQIFSAAAIYDLPFGRGKQWLRTGVTAAVLGNWQFNIIARAQSGTPVVIHATGDPANVGNTQYNYDRPNLVGNPHIAHPSDAAWLNTAAFQQPVYAFGNAGRGLIRNPSFQNADMSVFKNIPIPSATQLSARFTASGANRGSFNLLRSFTFRTAANREIHYRARFSNILDEAAAAMSPLFLLQSTFGRS